MNEDASPTQLNSGSLCCQTKQSRFKSWKGKNVFICGGRLLLGVHVSHFGVTFTLTVLTWVAYCLLVIPFLGRVELYALPLLLGTVNIGLLFAVAFSDPGILPRQHFQHGKLIGASLIRKDAAVLRSNFCRICNIWRPSRARHCKYCDNCVDIFDHHCPWTGTCIGIRNYPHFLLFIISVWTGAVVILLSSLYVLFSWIFAQATTNHYYLRLVALCVTIPWSCMLLFLVGTLLSFHLYLIFRGQTTNEYFRQRRAAPTVPSMSTALGNTSPSETTSQRMIETQVNTVKALLAPSRGLRCLTSVLGKSGRADTTLYSRTSSSGDPFDSSNSSRVVNIGSNHSYHSINTMHVGLELPHKVPSLHSLRASREIQIHRASTTLNSEDVLYPTQANSKSSAKL